MCCAQPCSSNKVSSATVPFHSCIVVCMQSVKVDRLSFSQDALFARALRSLPAQVKSGLEGAGLDDPATLQSYMREQPSALDGLVTWDKALEARGRASGVADTALSLRQNSFLPSPRLWFRLWPLLPILFLPLAMSFLSRLPSPQMVSRRPLQSQMVHALRTSRRMSVQGLTASRRMSVHFRSRAGAKDFAELPGSSDVLGSRTKVRRAPVGGPAGHCHASSHAEGKSMTAHVAHSPEFHS